MRVRQSLTAAAALVFLSAAGCGGGDLATVEGDVTFDGRPLKGAVVVFKPLNGKRPSSAKTTESGRYRLLYTQAEAGAEVGKHSVIISDIPQDSDTAEVRAARVRLPARYNVKSMLEADVQPRANQIDFALSSSEK